MIFADQSFIQGGLTLRYILLELMPDTKVGLYFRPAMLTQI